MFPMSSVVIDWSGKRLTGEQMLIVQNAAMEFDDAHDGSRLMFSHKLCDGLLQCKGRMQHGVFVGTRFVAYLDTEDGTERKYEFLLTDTYRKMRLPKGIGYAVIEPRADAPITPINKKSVRGLKTEPVRLN